MSVNFCGITFLFVITHQSLLLFFSTCNFVSEELLLEALELAQENNIKMAELQKKIAQEIAKDKMVVEESDAESVITPELIESSSVKINDLYDKGLSKSDLSEEKKKLIAESKLSDSSESDIDE